MNVLTPKQTVEQLDKYIIGQDEAKRTVAIALRNRYRRSRLPEEMREEIIPKNIIMVGPTGVGKTEIARRLAKLVDAPFVKVEATKFTEVGYVGRDVDSMIRDLVEASIRLVKAKRTEEVRLAADAAAEKRIVDILCGKPAKQTPNPADSFSDGLAKLFGSLTPGGETGVAVKKNEPTEEQTAEHISKRNKIISDLQAGRLEDEMIEIEVAETATGNDTMLAMGIDLNLNEMFGGVLPKKTKARKVTVRDARRILSNEESEKLVDMDAVVRDAIDKAEQDGIVFIDEIDKIATKGAGSGPDVSREGVQRDILPIVEGSVVSTKYGPVRTNYMLFIAAGAFHVSKIIIPYLTGYARFMPPLKSLQQSFRALSPKSTLTLTAAATATENAAAARMIPPPSSPRIRSTIEAVMPQMSMNAAAKIFMPLTAQLSARAAVGRLTSFPLSARAAAISFPPMTPQNPIVRQSATVLHAVPS